MTTIYFDMDGTIADLYAVENWLPMLEARDPAPYAEAVPLLDMRRLARRLNQLQRQGYRIGVISWLARNSTADYDAEVRRAKRRWLAAHLPSVDFDEIHIVKHGTGKHFVAADPNGILFDDEQKNRDLWRGASYTPDQILEVLAAL